MYGTIAHFHVLPGTKDDFIRMMDSFGTDVIPGWRADYYFQMDRDSDEFFLVAIFEDKPSYDDNANSAEQHQRYLKFRSFLSNDPQWNDGVVVSATGPKAKG